ncbi:MAG: cupin domain-containing protein [bacterium]|nr:cupin domain-containing protein [bacterium]
MPAIKVERPDKETLKKMGVFSWPVWEKEVSRFDWSYDSTEICYLLKGRVVVTPENGEPVSFGADDLVTFPKGLKCVWDIKEAVKKHYQFRE